MMGVPGAGGRFLCAFICIFQGVTSWFYNFYDIIKKIRPARLFRIRLPRFFLPMIFDGFEVGARIRRDAVDALVDRPLKQPLDASQLVACLYRRRAFPGVAAAASAGLVWPSAYRKLPGPP
jgi:hypothetical protein